MESRRQDTLEKPGPGEKMSCAPSPSYMQQLGTSTEKMKLRLFRLRLRLVWDRMGIMTTLLKKAIEQIENEYGRSASDHQPAIAYASRGAVAAATACHFWLQHKKQLYIYVQGAEER